MIQPGYENRSDVADVLEEVHKQAVIKVLDNSGLILTGVDTQEYLELSVVEYGGHVRVDNILGQDDWTLSRSGPAVGAFAIFGENRPGAPSMRQVGLERGDEAATIVVTPDIMPFVVLVNQETSHKLGSIAAEHMTPGMLDPETMLEAFAAQEAEYISEVSAARLALALMMDSPRVPIDS